MTSLATATARSPYYEAAVLAREPAMRGSAAAIEQALARIRAQAGR